MSVEYWHYFSFTAGVAEILGGSFDVWGGKFPPKRSLWIKHCVDCSFYINDIDKIIKSSYRGYSNVLSSTRWIVTKLRSYIAAITDGVQVSALIQSTKCCLWSHLHRLKVSLIRALFWFCCCTRYKGLYKVIGGLREVSHATYRYAHKPYSRYVILTLIKTT